MFDVKCPRCDSAVPVWEGRRLICVNCGGRLVPADHKAYMATLPPMALAMCGVACLIYGHGWRAWLGGFAFYAASWLIGSVLQWRVVRWRMASEEELLRQIGSRRAILLLALLIGGVFLAVAWRLSH